MFDSILSGKAFTRLVKILFALIQTCLRAVRFGLDLAFRAALRFVAKPLDRVSASVAKRLVAQWTPVKNNVILFNPFQGEYTCNLKYICEELLSRDLPYEIVWVLRGSSLGPYPSGLTFVRNNSPDYYRYAAQAKVIIQNSHTLQLNKVSKKKDQYLLQTWHGSLGLKRLEGAGGDDKYYQKMKFLGSSQTDFVISNSDFEDNIFDSTYFQSVPVWKHGHARNDILFDRTLKTAERIRRKVLSRLQIEDSGQRFLLFAPTHAEGSLEQSFGNLSFEHLKTAMQKRFGGEWNVLVRTHTRDRKQAKKWLSGLPTYCYDASPYPDMQELLVLADAGLTDYSSWICDFILTRKPAFLFGVNVRDFNQSRGFYFDLETETPFSLATSNAELLQNIANFNHNHYEEKIEQFLENCGCIDDGNSAARIVDGVEKLMSS